MIVYDFWSARVSSWDFSLAQWESSCDQRITTPSQQVTPKCVMAMVRQASKILYSFTLYSILEVKQVTWLMKSWNLLVFVFSRAAGCKWIFTFLLALGPVRPFLSSPSPSPSSHFHLQFNCTKVLLLRQKSIGVKMELSFEMKLFMRLATLPTSP